MDAMPNLSLRDQTTEFLLYTAPNGTVKVEVLLSEETIWLTQKRMAELFGVGVAAISKHLENIYEAGELQRDATLSILETVQQEGARQVTRKLEFPGFLITSKASSSGAIPSRWRALPRA